jgi:hypothetical protein
MIILELLPAHFQPWLPLFTFFAGTLIGHRLALWSTRRQEFNKAVEPVRRFLLLQRQQPSANRVVPDLVARQDLHDRLYWWRRRSWLRAWEHYEQACKDAYKVDALGQGGFVNTERIVAAVEECLALVRFR